MPSNCDQINEAVRNTRTVLVFGATGKQGGAVAAALKSEGWQVRALVRNLDSARAKALVLSGVQIFQGDFADVEAIRTAMAGVHGVFSVQPYSGSASSDITDAEEVRFGKSIADIAVETGVRHFVYSSAGILSKGRTGLPNLDCKIEIEDHIRSLQMASTIVRPSTFMDLFVLTGMGLDSGVFSFFLRPEQRAQLIAVEDIGKVVATIFGNTDRYTNRTIEIAGDEVSGIDLQEVLSKAAGRLIVYERFSDALRGQSIFAAQCSVVRRGSRHRECRYRRVAERIWTLLQLEGVAGRAGQDAASCYPFGGRSVGCTSLKFTMSVFGEPHDRVTELCTTHVTSDGSV